MNFLINSLLTELGRFEYTEQSPATFNGVKESQGDEFYYHKILLPLAHDFEAGISQFHISEGINHVPPAKIITQLQTLIQKIEGLIQESESRSIIKKWREELRELRLSEEINQQRIQSLRFLLNASNFQLQKAKDAISAIRPLIWVLENPDKSPYKNRQYDTEENEPNQRFILTEYYSKAKNITVLTDLRNDLISIGKLSKNDPNNTLSNFKSFFVPKGGVVSKEIKPIKFYGYANELQHLIYILTEVLIEQNYTEESNYRIAFKLFVDKEGNRFTPKKERWSAPPAPDKAAKIESVLTGIRVHDTSNRNKKNN